MSEADEEKLLADLESYVCAMRTKGLLLWYFGQYDTEITKLSMEKRAPAFSALLDNADLFKVILKYSPSGRMCDRFFLKAIKKIIKDSPAVKTKQFPDDIFATWWVGCIHVQLTHLRDLKKYPCRFAYRISLLDAPRRKMYDELMDSINLSSEKPEVCASSAQTTPKKGSLAAHCTGGPCRHRNTKYVPRGSSKG